jgi:FixJ family two-component response regulator
LVRSLEDLVPAADESSWGCVLVDGTLLSGDDGDRLVSLGRERPGFPWLLWAAELDVPGTVKAIKQGAVEVLRNPNDNAALPAAIQEAVRVGRERFDAWCQHRDIVKQLDQLSASEKHVLALVLQGRTNKEIATQLDFSLRTIEARRQRVLNIMQAQNAIETAVMLARHGLMDEVLEAAKPADASPQTASA